MEKKKKKKKESVRPVMLYCNPMRELAVRLRPGRETTTIVDNAATCPARNLCVLFAIFPVRHRHIPRVRGTAANFEPTPKFPPSESQSRIGMPQPFVGIWKGAAYLSSFVTPPLPTGQRLRRRRTDRRDAMSIAFRLAEMDPAMVWTRMVGSTQLNSMFPE